MPPLPQALDERKLSHDVKSRSQTDLQSALCDELYLRDLHALGSSVFSVRTFVRDAGCSKDDVWKRVGGVNLATMRTPPQLQYQLPPLDGFTPDRAQHTTFNRAGNLVNGFEKRQKENFVANSGDFTNSMELNVSQAQDFDGQTTSPTCYSALLYRRLPLPSQNVID